VALIDAVRFQQHAHRDHAITPITPRLFYQRGHPTIKQHGRTTVCPKDQPNGRTTPLESDQPDRPTPRTGQRTLHGHLPHHASLERTTMGNTNAVGFTLIDMMLSLFLSVLLMAGLCRVDISMAMLLRLSQHLADDQDKLRYLSSVLRHAIRNAGNTTCAPSKTATRPRLFGITGTRNDTLFIHACVHFHHQRRLLTRRFDIRHHTLYQSTQNGQREMILAHVDHFKLRYGLVNADSQQAIEKSAAQITHWLKVNSVEIQITINHHPYVIYTALRRHRF
jgi:type II secretory pathway component PulJ